MDLLPNKTNLFRNFKTKSREQINIANFVHCNTFWECCNPRSLNKTEIGIQKYNHQNKLNTLLTVKTKDMSPNQTIRTKYYCSNQFKFYYVKANVQCCIQNKFGGTGFSWVSWGCCKPLKQVQRRALVRVKGLYPLSSEYIRL